MIVRGLNTKRDGLLLLVHHSATPKVDCCCIGHSLKALQRQGKDLGERHQWVHRWMDPETILVACSAFPWGSASGRICLPAPTPLTVLVAICMPWSLSVMDGALVLGPAIKGYSETPIHSTTLSLHHLFFSEIPREALEI